jgi:hypothetical protein
MAGMLHKKLTIRIKLDNPTFNLGFMASGPAMKENISWQHPACIDQAGEVE